MKPTPLCIEAVELTKQFGGVAVVNGVSFQARAGEIVGLIGPNGAGKTTLFNLLSQVLRADSGTLAINGVDSTRRAPHELARLGLVRTFQLSRELDRLTVLENVLLAARNNTGERLFNALFRRAATHASERIAVEKAREALSIVSLSAHEAVPAAALSGGQKKLLELARCLMSGADIVLLDEIAAGVAPHLVEEIVALVSRLNRERGTTFVVIEHNVGVISRLCSRVVVMAQGSVIAEGSFDSISRDAGVIEAYLGQAA